jgi:putative protease
MGAVARVERDAIVIAPADAHRVAPLKAGDGVVFDAADWRSPEEPEEGGRVFAVQPTLDGNIELQFGNGVIAFSRIRPGDAVWRTHDPDTDRAARRFLDPAAPVARQPLRVRVRAAEGEPLTAEWAALNQPETRVEVRSAAPLERAQNRRVPEAALREQFGRLGNTP